MLKTSLLAALLCTSILAHAADPISIWPGAAPGEKGDIGPETDITKPTDAKPGGKRIIRLGNVSSPTLTVFKPAPEKDTGTAVVVCPGGGYGILAYDLEGTEVCDWLNSIGVTGLLLKYRVPARKDQPRHLAPLQDAQRAISLARQHASEWKIDSGRIGILGFSAGGHLSAATATNSAQRAYPRIDATDDVSCRPDFAALIYPAYLTVKDQGDKISPELTIDKKTPPTFLVQTSDDGIRVENAAFFYLALKNAKIPAELHIYAKGGHGYGLRPTELEVTHWPQRAEQWMRGLGLLSHGPAEK